MSRESSNVHDCFQLRDMRSRSHSRRGRIERDPSGRGLATVEVSRGAAAPPRRLMPPVGARGPCTDSQGYRGKPPVTRREARGAGPYARRR
jgi:hypothetical protein